MKINPDLKAILAASTVSLLAAAGLAYAGVYTVGVSGSEAGSIVLNGATSGAVTVNVPAVAGTTTFTLPGSNGTANQVLQTNGSGVTTWANAGTGNANTGSANTWTAPQTFSTRVASTPVVLSGAAPIPDASTTNVFTLTLSAATTIANPTNLVAGETLTFIITQAAGGYAVTWGANYKFSGTAPTMSTGSGKVDVYTCTSPAGTNCYMAGVSQNF